MITRFKRKFEEEKKEDDSVNLEQANKGLANSKSSISLEEQFKLIEAAAIANATKKEDNNLESSISSVSLEEQYRQIEEEARASVTKKQKRHKGSGKKKERRSSLKQPEETSEAQSSEDSVAKVSIASENTTDTSIHSILRPHHIDELCEIIKKKQNDERLQEQVSNKNQSQQMDEEAKKPAAIEQTTGSVRDMINAQIAMQSSDDSLSMLQDKHITATPATGGHVAALQNPSPVARPQKRTVIGDDDLKYLYNFVLNGGSEKDLTYGQRVYHKGLMAEAFEQVRETANNFFKDDKQQMLNYANYSQERAKEQYELGNIDGALFSIVQSKSMIAMHDSITQDQNNSIAR